LKILVFVLLFFWKKTDKLGLLEKNKVFIKYFSVRKKLFNTLD